MRIQTRPYTLKQYLEAGCLTLTRDGKLDLLGSGIHDVTGGMPCNGCFLMRTNCHAYAKLQGATAKPAAMPQTGETVRQEAARRGLSIGEVRRQRHAGIGVA